MRKAKMPDKEALARRSVGVMSKEDAVCARSVTQNPKQGENKRRIVPDWWSPGAAAAPAGIIKGFADLAAHRETC
jgi:hypothetical protein